MEVLNGENIHALPFRGVTKLNDLIYFDGPVLTHFVDKYGKDILFYWVDANDELNRWLVFQVSEKQLYQYLSKQITLKNVIESPVNDLFYTVEIGDQFEYKNVTQIFKEDLNQRYIPEEGSFFLTEVPLFYHKGLVEYQESSLVESFLEHSAFIKAEPRVLKKSKSKSKNHGLVDMLSGAELLNGYGTAYKKLISYEIQKEFVLHNIADAKRIRKAEKQAHEASLLNMVKTKAASFAVAFCPNNISTLDESFLNKEWRDKVFNIFKRDIIDIDKKSEEEVDKLVEQYGENHTYDIYKPIIDLYNNKHIELNITDRNFNPKRTIKPIGEKIVKKLTAKKPETTEEPIDRLASVKVNPKTGKIAGTASATLFDQSIQKSWSADEIITVSKTYKLRHKLFAQYDIQNSLHVLEQDFLNIYATGESLQEAESDFSNQFHQLYKELTSKENKDLTYESIEIRNFLLLYVKS